MVLEKKNICTQLVLAFDGRKKIGPEKFGPYGVSQMNRLLRY